MKKLRGLLSTLMQRSTFKLGFNCLIRKKRSYFFFSLERMSMFLPGVDPNFICHDLNVNPAIVPRKQPSWRSSKEHVEAVKKEVNKLKRAGPIKEVFYPE